MTVPKNLDGIKGAKNDLRQALRRLREFVDGAEDYLKDGESYGALQSTRGFMSNVHCAVEAASQWTTLDAVLRGTYKNPREGTDGE